MGYPLADALQARGIPFLFLTGYGTATLPERFRTTTRLSKPCDSAQLIQEVRRMLLRG